MARILEQGRVLALALTLAAAGAGWPRPVAAAPKAEAREPARDPKTIKDPFARGMELYRQGKLDEALVAFRLEEEANPKDPIVHSWIGFVLFKKGRNAEAVKALNRSIQLGPNNPDTYNNLGNAYLADGQTDAAIEAYRQAVNLLKDRADRGPDPYYNLGNALVKKGDLDGALAAFLEAERIDGADPLIQNNLGFVYERKHTQNPSANPLAPAVDHYRKALDKEPNNAVFQRNYGLAARKLDGRRDAALRALKRAVELDPKDYNSHLALAEEHQTTSPEQAISEYRIAAALRPAEFIPRYNLGLLYARQAAEAEAPAVRQKHYQSAIQQLDGAVKLRPTDARALSALGWVNFKAGRLEQAASWYAKAIQAAPDQQAAHVNLGLVQEQLKRPDAAIQSWKEAIRLDPTDAATRALLASAFLNKGRFQEAAAEYQNVIKLNSKDARSHNNLGYALEKLGKLDDAITAYKAAIELDPRLAIAHNNLGAAYERRGNPELAKQHYQRARQLDPNLEDAKRNLQRLNGG
jgi:tetratricopeptide (TPR) repeat protein